MSLVFRTPLISNSTDVVGGHNGVDTGITYAGGANFNGITSQINFGTDSFFEFSTSPFTIMCQIKTMTTTRRTFFSKFNFNNGFTQNGYFADVLANGKIRAAILTNGSNYYIIDSAISVNDGKLHTIAFARSGATFDLYVDGVLNNGSFINAGTVSTIATGNNFVIGKQDDATSTFSNSWDNLIKDFRFYSTKLTASEIQKAYPNSNFFPFFLK